MKIVLLAKRPDVSDFGAQFPNATIVVATGAENQIREIADADAIYGLPSRDVFRAARKLRWIHNPGTGIDTIRSIPELVDSDVILTNALGPHVNPMADHVFAQLLALTHRIPQLWDDQKAHRWQTGLHDTKVVELNGKTLGVIAMGGLGQAIARRGVGFGMRVIGVDQRAVTPPDGVEAVWGIDRLDDLLSTSDFVAVASPLTRQTKGMIDQRRIGLIRRGGYLLVISRGGIVNEDALVKALRDGHLAGAGIDVTETEPLPPDSPLWETPNLLISPHSSALTPEMWEGRREIYRENLRRFLAEEPLINVCDKEAGF